MASRRILFLTALALALSGCSIMPSWLGGSSKEKPRLAGTRIDVLPADATLPVDPSVKDTPVTLPAPTLNADWPQHTGVVTAASGNLGAKGTFDTTTSASVGQGEEFDYPLVPRPVVAGGMVFAMDAAGNISAHDAENISTIRWNSKGVSEKHAPEIMGGGLAYDGGRLYATSGRGLIVALDAATGNELWRKSLQVSFPSAPRVAGGELFAISLDNQVFALNAASGEVLWTQRGIDETARIMNAVSPAVTSDTLIVPYSSGELYALATADGKEIWNDSLLTDKRTQASSVFSGIGSDPVIDGDVVFTASSGGLLSAFYLPSGKHVWDKPIGSLNTPWLAGDYLFVLSSDDTLICFVKYDGRVRWATPLRRFKNQKEKKDPIVWRGPVLVNNQLAVVGSNGDLLLISAEDGKVVATKSVAENIYTAPVVAGGRMYLVSQDATLYQLQ